MLATASFNIIGGFPTFAARCSDDEVALIPDLPALAPNGEVRPHFGHGPDRTPAVQQPLWTRDDALHHAAARTTSTASARRR
jgi:hypothetical protein